MKDFYWDVRPKPEYGTVEIRVCDTPLTVDRAAQIAAFAQALARSLLDERSLDWITPDLYLAAQLTTASRRAAMASPERSSIDGRTRAASLADDIRKTLERAGAARRGAGVGGRVRPADDADRPSTATTRRGCAASFAETGTLPDVVRRQAARWATGEAVFTTFVYSLLALDQSLATLAAQYGTWLYAILFVDHLRGDGARGLSLPAGRFDPVHLPARSSPSPGSTSTCSSSCWSLRRCSAIRSITPSATTSARRRSASPIRAGFARCLPAPHPGVLPQYGGLTIIIGRFVPIIRTFAPFLAGVAGMSYRALPLLQRDRRLAVDRVLVYAGYLFGNIPWVKHTSRGSSWASSSCR